ncbi:aminoacyl-tRNA hydrolase [Paenibacillus sp. y28]|uniref:aminoacyl-tRNA hydrolase n=1 Tax=Paenibacillus sp. y28 TaxID=3129110 RepID=UPI003017E931
MKWIVGLGNPGAAYQDTRHNIGFMAVDRFAARHSIAVTQARHKAVLGEGHVGGQKVVLIKPMTYMNLSGEALRSYMDFYKASIDDLIVLYDDMDTPYGNIRLRYQGSPGGHNGMKSLIQHLGTPQFNRIRLGISRPRPGFPIVDYVLTKFTKEEFAAMPDVLDRTCDALEHALQHPFEKTMGLFNASS